MNNKIIKIVLKIQGLILAGMLLFACTDELWDGHYKADPALVSSNNLWTTIESMPELSRFAQILQKHGYDQLLSQTQSYTVFAPDNDALAAIDTAGMDVEKELIKNHIARFILPASGDTKVAVATLNGKRISLNYDNGTYSYGDAAFSSSRQSVVASNGLVHVLSAYEHFFPNVWESLAKGMGLDSVKNYLYSFDQILFDKEASVPGSVVDGQQTYIDSVFVNTNAMLGRLGYVNREDSSYTMLVPTNAAWIKAYDNIKNYFVYKNLKGYPADSLQRVNTKAALVQDLIFNNNLQASPNDSLVSTSHNTFYKPQYLFDGAEEKVITSNGFAYITNELKIDALDSWHKPIKVEAEYALGRENNPLSTPYTERVKAVLTNISGGRYLRLSPLTSTGNPTVTFDIPGTLSSYYDIYCVFVSPYVVNPNAEGVKPCKVNFNLSYLNSVGDAKMYQVPSSGTIQINPNVMDTVLIASNFKFPVANYGEKDATVKLKVASNVGRKETTNFSLELLIDCILLKPKKQ